MSTITTVGYIGVGNQREYFNVIGAATPAYIECGGGTDAIEGSSKNDYLIGGGDRDVIYAGAGNDIIIGDSSYYDEADTGSTDTSALADFLSGQDGDDIIFAGGGRNWVNGDAGNDWIYGGSGDEFLQGGSGDDTIYGGAGDDILVGGTRSFDDQATAKLAYFGGSITMDFDGKTNAAQSNTYSGSPQTQVLTGTGKDYLDGGDGDDNISGQDGDDVLLGGSGDDTLNGGEGADKLDGGTGVDIASYAGATKGVTANLKYMTANTNDAKGDKYYNIENLTGSSYADILTGNDGDNRMSGGAGGDRIDGGLGTDILIGYTGQDTFVFSTKLGSTNIDTIYDFTVADDTILLDDDIFTKAGTVGDLASGAFYTGTKAHDTSDRIIYDKVAGKLLYDADGTGSIAAVQFAIISKGLAITAADFDIIA